MPTQTRLRARSSVDQLFDLVENLEDAQLESFLDELNSTPHESNIPVSSGVAYFEEEQQRRRARHATPTSPRQKQQPLRPTPSFLSSPPEPKDWPRQKPRPVSGSQWRGSMRIVSAPYSNLKHTNTTPTSTTHSNGNGNGIGAPLSPPLTASPPGSPPIRRSVTAPVLESPNKKDSNVYTIKTTVAHDEPSPPVSPPRGVRDDGAALGGLGALSFNNKGANDADSSYSAYSDDEDSSISSSRPISEAHEKLAVAAVVIGAPPTPVLLQPAFERMSTMPAALGVGGPLQLRPRTATGHAAASARTNPRAFRRVSRPHLVVPGASGDEMARRLMSAFLFGEAGAPAPARRFGERRESGMGGLGSLEDMLKEPASPRSRAVFGRSGREVDAVHGIFEVLKEG